MAKLITFKTPVVTPKTREHTIEDRQGYVVLLYVGNYQEKFVLQVERDGTKPEKLVHYASGYVFGDLNSMRIQCLRSYSSLTDREAAKRLIDDVVAKRGADNVREIMAGMSVLNA